MSTKSGLATHDAPLHGGVSTPWSGQGVGLEEALFPGQVIDHRYRLVRKLGEGGMGVVFLAEHVTLGRRVALKTLKAGRGTELRHQKRLEREARIGSSVHHEHVARILDAGQLTSGRPYFVLEFVDGCGLDQLIERGGPMAPTAAVELMVQVARGVAAAHSQGVLHRDLKPHNIMIVEADDGGKLVKVLDFGLSKWDEGEMGEGTAECLTDTGFIAGTPQYMAPEMIRGECSGSRAADVYALGAIFYELLGGGRLHDGSSPNAILYSALSKTPAPIGQRVPGLPAPIVDLVQRAISKDAVCRPEARAFAAELEEYQRLAKETPSLLARVPRSPRVSGLSPLVLLGLSVIAALGVAFTLGFFVGAWQPENHTRSPSLQSDASATGTGKQGAGPSVRAASEGLPPREGPTLEGPLTRDASGDFRAAPVQEFLNTGMPAAQGDGKGQSPRAQEVSPLRNGGVILAAPRPLEVRGPNRALSSATDAERRSPPASHPGDDESPMGERPLTGFVTENPYD